MIWQKVKNRAKEVETPDAKEVWERFARDAATGWNAFLATDSVSVIDNFSKQALSLGTNAYDKAMDAAFNAGTQNLGGNWHRLFDGGHTAAGAGRPSSKTQIWRARLCMKTPDTSTVYGTI